MSHTQHTITIEGVFQHLIYSPKGGHEGALLHRDGAPTQLVFGHHDHDAGRVFDGVRPGQAVRVEATPQGPSPKGEGAHPVYDFGRLVAVDGKQPPAPKPADTGAAYRGQVVRLNYARHGAANGFVLDSGDFIHTRPDGMARLAVRIGDTVEADGDAQRLVDDAGWAVEAATVNGRALPPR